MWKLENSLQITAFAVCLLFGAVYCILYDLLRAVRKVRRFSDFKVALQDIVYFLFISIVTFLLFLKYTYGEIRLYVFVAIFVGFFLFRWTLSRFFIKISVRAVGIVMRFVNRLKRLKNKFFQLFRKYTGFFKKYCKNTLKFFKNLLKHRA